MGSATCARARCRPPCIRPAEPAGWTHARAGTVKVDGQWRHLYRAIDQFGQVIDVYASKRLNREAARRSFNVRWP